MAGSIPELDPHLRGDRPDPGVPARAARTVGGCMSTEVYAVLPEDTIYAAAELLLAAGVSAVPVVDHQGQLAGILTLTDLLKRLPADWGRDVGAALMGLLREPEKKPRGARIRRVRDLMTRPAIVATPDESLQVAAARMIEHRIHQLPVVEKGLLAGMVARSDIIAALVALAEREAGLQTRSAQRHLAARIMARSDQAGD
ncbi:MAG: CBS domain-containing protein [Candidatus Sericytochromatia bacterium]|nr:CBS domain-containing protein [Candidatus Tanganyikabacteria bacterium]